MKKKVIKQGKKKVIEQGEKELVLHQNVARMRGKLTPVQSRGMNSILKRAYEIVTQEPDTQEFVIPTSIFLEDIQLTDTSSSKIVIKRLEKQLGDLMVVKFDWGTTQSPNMSIFMSDVKIDMNEIKIHFSNYIREHIKPLNTALIVKDFFLLQSFKSEYARQLYKHLMAWDTKQIAEFTVDDLKAFLGVPKTESYKRMSNFKTRVLDKAVKEINERCPDMELAYTQNTTGKKITHIGFGWKKLKKTVVDNYTEMQEFCIDCVGKYIEKYKILKVLKKDEKFEVETTAGIYTYPNIDTLKNDLR